MRMNTEELKIWLDKPEGDHHDFKEHWYHKGQKPELVKDIFSFVNTVHHDDCLLILGVNDQRKVTGVEDDENWRLNQQQLIDFMRKLPISGELIPRLGVETIHIGEHEVDVIRIFNSNNVPVFLGRKWNEKGLPNNVILPGQIFTREQDVNTARDSTADYHQVERLFKKHFRMDTPIEERYKYTLSDTSNWRYTEADGFVFQYSPNPDFYMVLCDDDEDRYKAEAYSLDQFRTKMSWQSLKIKFRQSTIAGRVQNLFATGLPLTADPYSLNAFYKSVVLFRSEDEKNNLESLLAERIDDVESLIKPTEDEITGIAGRMAMDFKSTEQEVQDTTISYMLVQHAMGRLMNDCLLDYRRGNDISGVISRWRQKRTEG